MRLFQWRLTGWVKLIYRLTASHCSTEAHLAGVPFQRSFDSRLVKKIHRFRVLIKAFLVMKKGTKTTVLSRVAKFWSVVAPPLADRRTICPIITLRTWLRHTQLSLNCSSQGLACVIVGGNQWHGAHAAAPLLCLPSWPNNSRRRAAHEREPFTRSCD